MNKKFSFYSFYAALVIIQSLQAQTITVAPELGSAGIINAINTATDSDIIQLENGLFQATDTIVIDRPLTIRGSGSTKILFSDSKKHFLVHANQVYLQSFDVEANTILAPEDPLIKILAGNISPLKGIYVSGISFTFGSVGLSVAPIEDIHIENCQFHALEMPDIITAITLNHVKNATIENNQFHGPHSVSMIGHHAAPPPPSIRTVSGEPSVIAIQASLNDEALLIKGNNSRRMLLLSVNLETTPDTTQSVLHIKGNRVEFSEVARIYATEEQWNRAIESLCLVDNVLTKDYSNLCNGLFLLSSREQIPTTKWNPWSLLSSFSYHASNNTLPTPLNPESHVTIDPATNIGVDTNYFSTNFITLPSKKILPLDPDDQHTMHSKINAVEPHSTVLFYPGEYNVSNTLIPPSGVKLIGLGKPETTLITTQWGDPTQPLLHVQHPGTLLNGVTVTNKESGPVTFIVSEESAINFAVTHVDFYLKESDFALEAVKNILHVEKCSFQVTPRSGMRGGILLYGHPSGYTSIITHCDFDGNTQGDTTPDYRAIFCRAMNLPTTPVLKGGIEISHSDIHADQALFGELQYTGPTPPVFTVNIHDNVCHIRESLCMIRTGNDRPLDAFSLQIASNQVFFDDPNNHKGALSLLGTLYPTPKWVFGNEANFFVATTTTLSPQPVVRTFHGKSLIGNDDFFQTSALDPAITFNHNSFIDSFDGTSIGNGGDLDDNTNTGNTPDSGGAGGGTGGDAGGGTGGDAEGGGTGGGTGSTPDNGGTGGDLPSSDDTVLPISFAQGMTVQEKFPSHTETIHILEWVHPDPSKVSHFTVQKSGSIVPLATVTVPTDAQPGDTFVHVIRAADPNWSHNAYTITAHTPKGSTSRSKTTTR